MNTDVQPESARNQERSWRKRLAWAVLGVVLVLVLLVAAFYTVENWRGNRAWVQYCAAAEARGESVRVPPRTPEMAARAEASLACAKDLEELYRGFDKAPNQLISPLRFAPFGQYEDLLAWSRHALAVKSGQTNQQPDVIDDPEDPAARSAAAAVVLESLQGQEAFLEKLRSACHPPALVYPFGYDGRPVLEWGYPPSPRVFSAINVCRYLKVKMTAELALGRTTEAFRDLQLMLDLGHSLSESYDSLITAIGSIACRKIGFFPLWAGLADRRFTDAELLHLQQLLVSADLVAEYRRVCVAERNQTIGFCEWLQRTGKYDEVGTKAVIVAMPLVPAGWMQLEKVNYARRFDNMLAAAFSEGRKSIRLEALTQVHKRTLRDLQRDSGLRAVLHHTAIASVLTPNLAEVGANCTSAQVMGDQIRVACGLERFYLRNAQYPKDLQQLVPEFIPQLPLDPLSGGAYQYAADENGRYRLWSVGPDGTDNAGLPGDEPYSSRPDGGDWVWCYPQ